ncbi:MAG: stage III sporulation protein AD [Clostridia bacterium]|nr:stage III sporulation protein AD [Clostridia bacterium]
MDILKICGFAIIAISLIMVVKETNKSFALYLTIITSVILMLYIISNMQNIFEMLKELTSNNNIQLKYLSLILKIAGISYLVEFAKNICYDSGETAIGTKIELARKSNNSNIVSAYFNRSFRASIKFGISW